MIGAPGRRGETWWFSSWRDKLFTSEEMSNGFCPRRFGTLVRAEDRVKDAAGGELDSLNEDSAAEEFKKGRGCSDGARANVNGLSNGLVSSKEVNDRLEAGAGTKAGDRKRIFETFLASDCVRSKNS